MSRRVYYLKYIFVMLVRSRKFQFSWGGGGGLFQFPPPQFFCSKFFFGVWIRQCLKLYPNRVTHFKTIVIWYVHSRSTSFQLFFWLARPWLCRNKSHLSFCRLPLIWDMLYVRRREAPEIFRVWTSEYRIFLKNFWLISR